MFLDMHVKTYTYVWNIHVYMENSHYVHNNWYNLEKSENASISFMIYLFKKIVLCDVVIKQTK